MDRPVLEPTSVDQAQALVIDSPVRFVFVNPRRGGPGLGELRRALAGKGRLRFSGTAARIFVDVDPGIPAAPVIALDTIARSDAAGLERMILSVLGHVDQIILGVDARSDEETRAVARAYADECWTFDAVALGLSPEAWEANKIDFAAARNLGRRRVTAPWVLVVDTDEYLVAEGDLRDALRGFPSTVDAARMHVRVGEFEQEDRQRLARVSCCWWSATHNQLHIPGDDAPLPGAVVVHDVTLRSDAERTRRNGQRNDGIKLLEEEAANGQLIALFHLAKHKLSAIETAAEGVKLAQDYRFRAEPHGPLTEERMWIAVVTAMHFYDKDDFVEAELWCLRAMLDGPCVEALCLLGDIAEDQGDLERALRWYEAACTVPENKRLRMRGFTDLRTGRRDGLRRELARRTEEHVPPDPKYTYERVRDLAEGGSRSKLQLSIQRWADTSRSVVCKRVDKASRAALLREFRIMQPLDHPNVVRVYDGGDDVDGCFVAMEYVDGLDLMTLRNLCAIEGRTFPVAFAALIAQQLCVALKYVHGCDIVHGDINPRNVLVSYQGAVKLIDFGAARVEKDGGYGTVRGALAFIAPEQARGELIDVRADVYGVGALLYYLFTGKRPHEGATEVELLLRVQRGQHVPLVQLRPDLPPAVVAVVERALATDKEVRYAYAGALRRALCDLQTVHRQTASSVDEAALASWLADLVPVTDSK